MTSLYVCELSGRSYRMESGRGLVCMCRALPLGCDPGPKLGPGSEPFGEGRIGPPRPYYHDREHPMTEIADDGRDAEDLREAVWLA